MAVVAGLAATSAAAVIRAEADPPQRHPTFITAPMARAPHTLERVSNPIKYSEKD